MKFDAVVEIVPGEDGCLPADLMRVAYAASRNAPIAFLLRDIERSKLERALDEIVSEIGLNVHGVAYLDFPEILARLAILSDSHLVIAASDWFGRWLDENGFAWVDAASGVQLLRARRPAAEHVPSSSANRAPMVGIA